jgi:hypothetical protein
VFLVWYYQAKTLVYSFKSNIQHLSNCADLLIIVASIIAHSLSDIGSDLIIRTGRSLGDWRTSIFEEALRIIGSALHAYG